MPITMNYTASSVMDTPNRGRSDASLEVVPLPSKTSNCGMYRRLCEWGLTFPELSNMKSTGIIGICN